MYLKEQTYVCALAETGSMTAAAARLFITQPALSAYIKCLEERMGLPLFVRRQGQYSLTEPGKIYVETARKMLALQEHFNLEMQLLQGGRRGRLRVGLQTRRSPMIIAAILRFFHDHYPDIALTVEEGNQAKLSRMLKDNVIDVMICSVDRREEGMGYRLLGRERLLLAVHKDNPVCREAEKGEGKYPFISLDKLGDAAFFVPLPEQSLRKTCDRLFRDLGFAPNKMMEIRSIEASLRLVSEGLGVAFNRTSYAESMCIPDIRYFRIRGDDSFSEVVMAYAAEYDKSRVIADLLEGLAERLTMPET